MKKQGTSMDTTFTTSSNGGGIPYGYSEDDDDDDGSVTSSCASADILSKPSARNNDAGGSVRQFGLRQLSLIPTRNNAAKGGGGNNNKKTLDNHDDRTDEESSESSKEQQLASKETQRVNLAKLLVLMVLMVAAVTVSYMAYRLTKDSEVGSFEGDIHKIYDEILEASESHTKKLLAMTKGISTAYTATYAITKTSITTTPSSSSTTANDMMVEMGNQTMMMTTHQEEEETQEDHLQHNMGWPNVHLPFFDIRAKEAKDHSKAQMIVYAPIVHAHQRESWESFIVKHNDYTMKPFFMNDDGSNNDNELVEDDHSHHRRRRQLESHNHDDHGAGGEQPDEPWMPQRIHRLDGSLSVEEIEAEDTNIHDMHASNNNDSNFYVPLYQMEPLPPIEDGSASRIFNLDLMSYDPIKILLEKVLETKHPTLSEILDLEFLYDFGGSDGGEDDTMGHVHTDHKKKKEEDPHAMLIYPVFDNFIMEMEEKYDNHDHANDDQHGDHTIRGFVFAIFPFHMIFKNDEMINDMYAVLSDTCGSGSDKYVRQFTYYIDDKKATYLGKGDHHETEFDNWGTSRKFELGYGEEDDDEEEGRRRYSELDEDEVDEGCKYHVDIYPSSVLYESYITNNPIIYAIIVLAIFIGTALVFILYQFSVEHRQTVVMKTATNANAIVANLFPKEIQERMIQDAEDRKLETDKLKNKDTNKKNAFGARGAKVQLENFLADGETSQALGVVTKPFATKPIAELYPATTIMMADICGFTAWCSAREPSQVFSCLETIYHAFDVAATKHKVFKVETVGDCYVAVSGVVRTSGGQDEKKHFITMAKYARACMKVFKKLVRSLEVSLGPDTSLLDIRFGLHSGPVTAGVLRGDKARFQLFGDTVNTASRIENSSEPGKIHVSIDTATLLQQAGKGDWLEERPGGPVELKGKGTMQTYWLTTNNTKVRSPGSVISNDGGNLMDWTTEMDDMRDMAMNTKSDRLIEWNTEQLVRLLKEIEARRRLVGTSSDCWIHPAAGESTGHNPLDEWKEIIVLPKDVVMNGSSIDDDNIEINPEVIGEVRDFVRTIAMMYNDGNAFHNFEHASHVASSVNKLLSRIVTHEGGSGQNSNSDLSRTTTAATTVAQQQEQQHDPTYGITSDPLTRFACVFSSLIHDVDHPGVPNMQLIKENPKLAALYQKKSVAEQYSIDLSWSLLMEDKYTNFRTAIFRTQDELNRFRQLVVNSVLATDIMDKELKNLRNGRWDKAFKKESSSSSSCQQQQEEEDDGDAMNNRKATIVIEHLIQASDVAHTMQHWDVYRTWNKRFFRECYQAYLDGRAGDKDPSVNWYKGEIGFFDFYIIPLAKKLADCGVFGVSSFEYLNYAQKNREQWMKEGEEVVEQMLAEFHSTSKQK